MTTENMIANMEPPKRPTHLEIGEYELGLLPPDRAQVVATYLQRHPHAAQQHEGLTSFLAALEPQKRPSPSLKEQVNILIAQLLPSHSWQVAGVRGEQSGIYQVGEMQVTLTIDSDLDAPALYVLVGVATGGEWATAPVALWLTGVPEAGYQTECDEDGHFMLNGVEAGVYELILQHGETAVHIPDLKIGT